MFKLKDIFTPSSNNKENIEESSNVIKKDDKLNRMNELIKSFDNKNEIIKENESKELTVESVEQSKSRFKKLVEYNQISPNMGSNNPVGQTVNTIPGAPGITNIGANPNNPTYTQSSPDMYKGTNVYALTEDEALEVCVKRALKSGAPVNNLSFYDEVNWNLGTLGFSPKLPVDIKDCIVKCMESKVEE